MLEAGGSTKYIAIMANQLFQITMFLACLIYFPRNYIHLNPQHNQSPKVKILGHSETFGLSPEHL